jgi:hypothetical protein
MLPAPQYTSARRTGKVQARIEPPLGLLTATGERSML